MKHQHSEEIERRKNRLGKRLGRGSRPAKGGPMLCGGNERFEMGERTVATSFGGLGLLHRLVRQLRPPEQIDGAVQVFEGPSPYRVSDHVQNLTDCAEIYLWGRALGANAPRGGDSGSQLERQRRLTPRATA